MSERGVPTGDWTAEQARRVTIDAKRRGINAARAAMPVAPDNWRDRPVSAAALLGDVITYENTPSGRQNAERLAEALAQVAHLSARVAALEKRLMDDGR